MAGKRGAKRLVWDQADDEWFADCPVVLDFDDERVEITHQKFDELSITWNSLDPHRQRSWSDPEDTTQRSMPSTCPGGPTLSRR